MIPLKMKGRDVDVAFSSTFANDDVKPHDPTNDDPLAIQSQNKT